MPVRKVPVLLTSRARRYSSFHVMHANTENGLLKSFTDPRVINKMQVLLKFACYSFFKKGKLEAETFVD